MRLIKEYWIEFDNSYQASVYEVPVDGLSEDAIHVVDYKNYQSLELENIGLEIENNLLNTEKDALQKQLDNANKLIDTLRETL